MRKTTPYSVAAVGVLAVFTLLAGAQSASAAGTPTQDSATTRVTSPMRLEGYDLDVAAANGFKILTDGAGVQRSVAVSADAKSVVARSAAEAHANAADDVANGLISRSAVDAALAAPCGTSYLTLTASNLTLVKIQTGYTVRLPTLYRWWGVTTIDGAGAHNISLNDQGPGPAKKDITTTTRRTGGGWGYVNAGSHVQLTDGAICYSTGPQDTF